MKSESPIKVKTDKNFSVKVMDENEISFNENFFDMHFKVDEDKK